MVDTIDSKSITFKSVSVRVRPPLPFINLYFDLMVKVFLLFIVKKNLLRFLYVIIFKCAKISLKKECLMLLKEIV